MKILRTKPEKLKIIEFDEFVDYVVKKSSHPHWSTYLLGVSITHENDSHYILMPENGQVDFRKGQVLCVREDFSMFTTPNSDIMHQTGRLTFTFEIKESLLEYLEKF